MTDPTKPEADKDKFAPKNVAEADKTKNHRGEFTGRDLPRGSETATRSHARGRG